MESPYAGLDVSEWKSKTRELISAHPVDTAELHEIVVTAWDSIFNSGIGSKPFRIGFEIFPRPQIMGFLLHELVPLELEFRYPKVWRRDIESDEKDIVFVPDQKYSIEIKTSSSARDIYGNRSYAQSGKTSKKNKSGYYLAINFQKFTETRNVTKINLVRFGWLDHADWMGQASQTGQQARLSRDVKNNKLIELLL